MPVIHWTPEGQRTLRLTGALALLLLVLAAPMRAQDSTKVKPKVDSATAVQAGAPADTGKKKGIKKAEPAPSYTHDAYANCVAKSAEELATWMENDVRANGTKRCGLKYSADSILLGYTRTFPELRNENIADFVAFLRTLHPVRARDAGFVGKIINLGRMNLNGSPDLKGWDRTVHPEEVFLCNDAGKCYTSLWCFNTTPHLEVALVRKEVAAEPAPALGAPVAPSGVTGTGRLDVYFHGDSSNKHDSAATTVVVKPCGGVGGFVKCNWPIEVGALVAYGFIAHHYHIFPFGPLAYQCNYQGPADQNACRR